MDQLELLFAPIDTQEVRVYGPSRILGYCATLLIVAGCSDKCRYFCRYFSGRCDNRGELVRAEYHTLYTTTICLRGYANKKAPTLCHKWGRVSIKERSVLVGRFVLIRCFFYSFRCSEQGGGHVAQGVGKGVGLCGFECCGLAVNDVAMEALGQPLGGAAEVFARDFAEVDKAAYFEACKPCGIGF